MKKSYFNSFYMTAIRNYSQPSISKYFCDSFPVQEWFPTNPIKQIKSIGLGVLLGIVTYAGVTAASAYFQRNFKFFGAGGVTQEAFKILDLFNNKSPWITKIWRGALKTLLVVVIPIFEEFLFRGVVDHMVKGSLGDQDNFFKKTFRILTVSLLFGAYHLSPFQNRTTNLYAFCVTAFLGIVLSLAKEANKNLFAPMAAHITYNFAVLSRA